MKACRRARRRRPRAREPRPRPAGARAVARRRSTTTSGLRACRRPAVTSRRCCRASMRKRSLTTGSSATRRRSGCTGVRSASPAPGPSSVTRCSCRATSAGRCCLPGTPRPALRELQAALAREKSPYLRATRLRQIADAWRELGQYDKALAAIDESARRCRPAGVRRARLLARTHARVDHRAPRQPRRRAA